MPSRKPSTISSGWRVQTAIVFELVNDSIHVSARSPDARIHVGNILHDAFEDVGSGGGHHNVAGGEIPLGIFADYTSDDGQLLDMIEQIITARLVAELNFSDLSEEAAPRELTVPLVRLYHVHLCEGSNSGRRRRRPPPVAGPYRQTGDEFG